MRFPYAYYRTYFDGQITGESYKGQMLVIEPEDKTSGEIDVKPFSNVILDSSLGNIDIDGFINGEVGQLLFLRNKAALNRVVLKNAGTGTQPIVSAVNKDLYLEPNEGATLLCCDFAGTPKWLVINHSANALASGTEALPSLYLAEDRNTGLYSPAADAIGLTSNGTGKLVAFSSYVSSLVTHRLSDGTVNLPALAFNSDPDTGFFKQVGGDIGIAMDGALTGFLSKTGIMGSLALQATNGFLLSDNVFQFNESDATTANGAIMGFLGVGTTDYLANYSNTPLNGIYAEGDIKSDGFFVGTATSAQFADLAERYHCDGEVEAGDVIAMGGAREIVKADENGATEILGVISTNPAFKMNDKMADQEDYPFVAMTGRVPCKVHGPVIKGQRLIISKDYPGVAEGYSGNIRDLSPFEVVGRSLSTDGRPGERKIEIVVGRL